MEHLNPHTYHLCLLCFSGVITPLTHFDQVAPMKLYGCVLIAGLRA